MITYSLFKNQSMLLLAKSRKDRTSQMWLALYLKSKYAFLSNKQRRHTRNWLTSCLKPRTCSCQQNRWEASKMLTYILFKIQSMLLSAISSNSQPEADSHPVQNHALFRNKPKRLARYRLTNCLMPRAFSHQQQVKRGSQMLTNQLLKRRACSSQQEAREACQMLTYILFKTQSMLLLTSKKGQPDADLHPVKIQIIPLSATSRKSQSDAVLHAV